MKNYRLAAWSILFACHAAWAAEETTPIVLTANADCAVYADGELVHAALKANAVHKIQLSRGDHLLTAACVGRQPWKQVIQVGREQKVVQIETAPSGVATPSPTGPTAGTAQPAAPSPKPEDLYKRLADPNLGYPQSPASSTQGVTSEASACSPSGVPLSVWQYVGGFTKADACPGTLVYDATQIGFTPDATFFGVGFRAPYSCQALCWATSEVGSIRQNVLQGTVVGAFHVKLNNGASYDFAPSGYAGPEKFRTAGMVKAFREKTGK